MKEVAVLNSDDGAGAATGCCCAGADLDLDNKISKSAETKIWCARARAWMKRAFVVVLFCLPPGAE